MIRLSFDQIKQRFAEEDGRKGPVTQADEIPMGYEFLTPEWFTATLCADTPGAQVTNIRLGEEDEGTASRRQIFLELNEAAKAAGKPESVFCKATFTLASRCLLGMNGAIEGEVTFFNMIRPQLDIEAPRAHFANFSPETLNSIIVLEDMTGDVEFCRHWTKMDEARVKSQMTVLAQLHGEYLQSPKLKTDLGHMITWPEFFRITVDEAGFGPQADVGFREAREVIPDRLFKRADEVWPATEASVATHLNLPSTVIHSDVHLKNWYVAGDGHMGLNDWQCMCQGHWGRDLAYSISTALTVEDRRNWDQDIVRHYVEELGQATGRKVEFKEAWLHFRRNLFGALAWWTPVLSPNPDVPDMQPRDTSLEFIKRMTHAIDDVDALDSLNR